MWIKLYDLQVERYRYLNISHVRKFNIFKSDFKKFKLFDKPPKAMVLELCFDDIRNSPQEYIISEKAAKKFLKAIDEQTIKLGK